MVALDGWLQNGCLPSVRAQWSVKSLHSLHWSKLVNRLSSAYSTVSMPTVVVLSMLSCLVASITGLVLSTSSRLALNSLRGLEALFPPQMSALLSGRSAHLALSFVAQVVVIWLITYQTEGLVLSSSVLCLCSTIFKWLRTTKFGQITGLTRE